jgi:hypothetical protein
MLCILSPLRNVEQYCARRLSRSPPHYSIAQATCESAKRSRINTPGSFALCFCSLFWSRLDLDVAKEMHFGAERINVGRTTHIREAACARREMLGIYKLTLARRRDAYTLYMHSAIFTFSVMIGGECDALV